MGNYTDGKNLFSPFFFNFQYMLWYYICLLYTLYFQTTGNSHFLEEFVSHMIWWLNGKYSYIIMLGVCILLRV
jgi:hypothetical protein